MYILLFMQLFQFKHVENVYLPHQFLALCTKHLYVLILLLLLQSKVRPPTTHNFIAEKHVFCHWFYMKSKLNLNVTNSKQKSGLLPEGNTMP